MRYLHILWLLVCFSCNSKDHFLLRGTIPGAIDSTTVVLSSLENPQEKMEEYVINEKFEFTGKCEVATCYSLYIDDSKIASKRKIKDKNYREINFFIENGELAFETPHLDSLPLPKSFVAFDVQDEKNYTVTGSAAQDVFYRYQVQTIPLRNAIHCLKGDFKFSRDVAVYRELVKRQEELANVIWEFVKNEPNLGLRIYWAGLLKKKQFAYDQAYLDSLARLVKADRDTCAALMNFRESLGKDAAFTYGTPLIDTKLLTPEGDSVSLRAQLNKEGYTLLDFWASWCGPCRASFPHIKKIHERNKEKLKVIGLSSDPDNRKWLNALNEEQLPWMQLHCNKALSASLRITSIPSFCLVDADGKIVFFGNRGDLDLKLEELGM